MSSRSSAGALIGSTHCKLKLTRKANQVKCWFLRRGENRSTRRKTSRCRVENQQTQPTYDAESGNRTRATLVGSECSHHCAMFELRVLDEIESNVSTRITSPFRLNLPALRTFVASFYRNYEPNTFTCSQLCGSVAHLVERCTGIVGSNPVEAT